MDSTKIKAIIVAVLATFSALYLGITAATAQLEAIAWVTGAVGLIVCLLLGRNIWLLIPFTAALNLTFRVPGQPTALLIGQGLFLGFSVLFLLMRKLPFRLHFTELEWWMVIVTAFVVQVYFRNPVGLNIFGGESVGGRPYAIYAVTLVSCLLMSGIQTGPAQLKWILRLSILGGVANFGLNLFGRFVPSIGFYFGAAGEFTDSDPTGENTPDPGRATRISFLGNAAKNISLWVSVFVSPLATFVKPLWLILLLISLGFAMMSGFRNVIATVGLTYMLGLLYRGGFHHFAASALLGALCIGALAVVNSTNPLPPNAQRALSFLPGTWEEHIRRDAEQSTDWRFEIWEEVLTTDRWISNKWLGDGLGFTTQELRAQLAAKDNELRGVSGFDAHRETILSNGDYHSGPVQTIRTIGYIGLTFLLAAMIRLAMHAHRLIRRFRNTEWFPMTMFVGIPLIIEPIFFVFVFGTFQSGASTLLLGIAMVRLLQTNLSPSEALPHPGREWVPMSVKNRAPNTGAPVSAS